MKNILLSLLVIGGVSAFAIGATHAYFSDVDSVAGNTFAAGTVNIEKVSGIPFTLEGLVPGKTVGPITVQLKNNGSMAADYYIGVDGSSPAGGPNYFADQLNVVIKDWTGAVKFNNTANVLSSQWKQIAQNIGAGAVRNFTVEFTLKSTADNKYQGRTNTDTVFYLYAVQTGYPQPATEPWETDLGPLDSPVPGDQNPWDPSPAPSPAS